MFNRLTLMIINNYFQSNLKHIILSNIYFNLRFKMLVLKLKIYDHAFFFGGGESFLYEHIKVIFHHYIKL